MLNSISRSINQRYPAAQKSTESAFLSLPLEVRQEIESRLDFSSRQSLFKALTTATRNGESIDSPVLRLQLIKDTIQARHQGTLICSDEGLKQFTLSQLQTLSDSAQLDKVVEKFSLFKLVCLLNASEVFTSFRELVHQDAQLKEKLLNWVERSKTEEVQTIAANALTLLVKAGVQFNHQDLKGIRVPGADLSYGVFDSVQLQGADLSGVNLSGSWLRQANLSETKMEGVRFGEWPYLQEKGEVHFCAFSPNGKACAVGLHDGTINVYKTSSWEKICTLQGHTTRVTSVAYSPSGHQIASSSCDMTVRLWDARSGKSEHVLQGHAGYVLSIAYSPNGQQITSGSEDATVRLWDAPSGESSHTLHGHTGPITRVLYSPSGRQIASGSEDRTVRLWDISSGQRLAVVRGFQGSIQSLAWKEAADGTYLLTGCRDTSVFRVIEEDGCFQVRLCWNTAYGRLVLADTDIKDAQGLSQLNKKLLQQRGAVGEPSYFA
ncbi:WD40 repeat domain-containing protein [Mycoavidus sp. SF9855]|uniref:WD40 repeat domain-containing protein n=1 Tax=Mycoavidus sp. SF9855 TaxID=2968475 RepID=UPI00211CEA2F|nr:WD40 repeat domain-containing protein [Mycoavidus sp. SF9855]UUM22117.1 pentapeptide repeat-containing protein [Mycoavidus sp. SF9855]